MRVPSPTFTALDLFCGCGGLTQGLKDAGFRVLGGIDNDSASVQTYACNHPETTIWHQDIRTLDTTTVLEMLNLVPGQLDLLAGCPPCQGFSTLRTHNGSFPVEDPRNGLLQEMVRFAEALRPRAVMMENVPGLVNRVEFRDFCSRMQGFGYAGSAQVLDAADYGVPQRRRRLIYLAGHHHAIPLVPGMEPKRTVRQVLACLLPAGRSGDPIHDLPERRSARIKALIRRIPKDGGSRTDLPEDEQLLCHRRCQGFLDVYGRMAWDQVAPTITSGCFNPSKGRFLHPEEHRSITLREAALLQGFPARYRFPTGGKVTIAAMIGNALPPPFIAAHAESIRLFLQNSPHARPREERDHGN